MIYFPNAARIEESKLEENVIMFQGFHMGLNTSVPSFQLTQKEMAECVDWKLNSNGQLETRGAITKYTDTAISGYPVANEVAVIDGTSRTIIAGSDYKIYYLDSLTPTLIGTAIGTPYLFPYNDCCMVCDGSYLKFLSDVSTLRMAYDAGTGGTQYDNYSGTDDSGIAIGNGTNVRAAVKFTSDTWDAGFTIPLTSISFFLQRVNPGTTLTGTITAKLRLVADDSILATKDCAQTAGDISTDGEFVDITFSTGTEMSRNTAYYMSIEYTGGDATNYLSLRCSDNGTHTNTGYAYVAAWAVDTGKNPIMRVHPGMPPKCSFGWVSKSRPWFAGDPDNKGLVWYGNLTHLDFSTGDNGGYITVIDEDSNSFPVGAGEDLYGEMFIYGTESMPYIARLEGDTPAEYSLPLMFQRGWATQKTLMNVGNDIWASSSSGTDALSGVQQYGDVRTSSASDRVKDRFKLYWDSSKSFAGYYPDDGQYWLCFNHASYSKILVGHTKQPFQDAVGVGFPWTEYDLPSTPTSFGTSTIGFMYGASDGYMYTFDSDEYKDLGTTQINPSFRTSYVELPFKSVDLIQFQSMMSSVGGSSMTISIYKNGNREDSAHDYTFSLAMSDTLTVDDLTFDIDDWVGSIDSSYETMFFDMNMNVRRFQIEYKNVKTVGYPVFFNGCILKYRKLKGL